MNNLCKFKPDKHTLEDYILFTLANSCMPCLVKIKPSNLVTFYKKYITRTSDFFDCIQQILCRFQCKYIVLHESANAYFILIYTPEAIEFMIDQYRNHPLLIQNGYIKKDESVEGVLNHLALRYSFSHGVSCIFPHEIGLFLGYPTYDVQEFIANKGENYIINGCWKVYHNVNEALVTFQTYQKVREQGMGDFLNDINIDIKKIKCYDISDLDNRISMNKNTIV
jgi:hypothetical protein